MRRDGQLEPAHVIHKSEHLLREQLPRVELSTSLFKLVLDVWLSAPLRFVLPSLVIVLIFPLSAVYELSLASFHILLTVMFAAALDVVRDTSALLAIPLAIIFIIAAMAIILLYSLPVLATMLTEGAIRQGIFRSMAGEHVPPTQWFFLQREYIIRVTVVYSILLICIAVGGLSVVGIPLLYIVTILFWSVFDFLLLSRPELPLRHIIAFTWVANTRNVGPLLLFGGLSYLLSVISDESIIMYILVRGIQTVLMWVYAASVTGQLHPVARFEGIADDSPFII